MQRLVGLLIAVATLLALAGRPLTRDDLRLLPAVPALALAAWAVLDSALMGVAGAGVGPAMLVGVVAVLLQPLRIVGFQPTRWVIQSVPDEEQVSEEIRERQIETDGVEPHTTQREIPR